MRLAKHFGVTTKGHKTFQSGTYDACAESNWGCAEATGPIRYVYVYVFLCGYVLVRA